LLTLFLTKAGSKERSKTKGKRKKKVFRTTAQLMSTSLTLRSRGKGISNMRGEGKNLKKRTKKKEESRFSLLRSGGEKGGKKK